MLFFRSRCQCGIRRSATNVKRGYQGNPRHVSRFGLGGLSADASAARIVNPRELKRLFLYPTTVLFAPASSLTDNPLRLIMKLQKMAQGCKEILTQVNHQRNWSLAHSGKVRPVNCLNSIFCDEAFHNRQPSMAGLAGSGSLPGAQTECLPIEDDSPATPMVC